MTCIKRPILGAACALLLAGCSTSSHVLLGTPRPPIAPDQVRVYAQPPARYEQIASINANSSASLALTGQQNMDKALERMKAEAAKLGANGILLQGVSDAQTGSIGTGVGSSINAQGHPADDLDAGRSKLAGERGGDLDAGERGSARADDRHARCGQSDSPELPEPSRRRLQVREARRPAGRGRIDPAWLHHPAISIR